jgi:sugar phosphate isomerase/epimerase
MFPLATIEGKLAEVIGVARTLGMGTIVAPFLPPPDRPTARGGWQALGARLNALARSLRAEDLAFAWHNHDFEVVPAPDGAVPLDVLLDAAPDLLWEADLGWIFRAGGDPLAWIRSRGNRITAVHLKDVQPHFLTAPEGGWADLGHGVNDWSEIFTALERLPLLQAYVAEHDDPSDLERFLKRWMASFLTGREQARTLNSSSSGVSR